MTANNLKRKTTSILCFLVFISFISSCGENNLKLNCSYDSTIESGKNFYQPLINALEKYKIDHNNYPTNIFELVPIYINKIPGAENGSQTANSSDDKGELYADKNIKSQIVGTRPDINSYFITFYFSDNSNCILSKNGVCSYEAKTKNWSCK